MIDVLLAAYEGERFLDAQIQSLLSQENADLRILARDDGSGDGTYFLLHAYETTESGRFFVTDGGGHMAVMQDMERAHGRDCPILVHSDLAVVIDGQIASGSLMHYQKLDPQRTELRRLLTQNVVTGCTVMINRALCDAALSRPHEGMLMHDWWLALIASAFGEIGYVDEATMLYRQHGDNRVGAKNARAFSYLWQRLREGDQNRYGLCDTYRQAQAFLDAFSDLLDEDDKELLSAYAAFPSMKKAERIRALCLLGTWKYGLLRKLGQILYI